MNVILASYNNRLAGRFSRKVKRVICDAAGNAGIPARIDATASSVDTVVRVQRSNHVSPAGVTGIAGTDARVPAAPASPFPFVRQRPKNTEAEWETTEGGGLRAVGVGGGVTGYGANLIIVDDPVTSRAHAESKKMREKVWDWFNDDLYTRLEPNGAIILIQTRWHEDDLAGRLLREMEKGGEQWEIVNLPALAEDGNVGIPARNERDWNAGIPARIDAIASTADTAIHSSNGIHESLAGGAGDAGTDARVPTDPLGRSFGEALCPERISQEMLENLKRKLGTYSFSSLYQQRPTPAEGVVFKREFFKSVVAKPPNGLRWKRGYDLAVSTKTTADYTASFRVAYDSDGNLYIDAGFRKRIEFPEQKRYILGRIKEERMTDHGIELALHGQAYMQELRRAARIQGRSFRGIKATGDKLSRALTWSALAEEGKVILVKGAWNADFIDEAVSFPAGHHDDQIDAVSIAVQMHQKLGSKLHVF